MEAGATVSEGQGHQVPLKNGIVLLLEVDDSYVDPCNYDLSISRETKMCGP